MRAKASWPRSAVAQHLRSRRFRIWIALLVICALGLATLPLFGVLGFEFSFVVAIAVSIAAADLGATAVRTLRATVVPPLARAIPPARVVFELFARTALAHLWLLIPPLAIISVNALRVQTCDWGFGLLAYLALPALSSVFGTGLGVVCGFVAGERKVARWLLPYFVPLILVGHSLYRFYAAPPVFSYNPLCGYFPGNLYDEYITLGAPLAWARLFQVAWLSALLFGVALVLDVPSLQIAMRPRPIRRRARTAAGFGAAVACAALLWLRSGSLGFSVDSEDIADALGGRRVTDHFVIHYPRGGDIERDIDLIAQDHEFRLAQLERLFDVRVTQRITSFYFQNSEEKFRWIGARGVYMAKPWRREIYLHHQPFPHQVLRHELAHVVAGQFGSPVFHVSAKKILGVPMKFSVGLIEGIAVAADWPDHFTRELTPHQSVKALVALDMLPPLESMMSTEFFAFSAARSYTVSGSFVRYLYDEHGGAQPLTRLYGSGGDFAASYGISFQQLTQRWMAMIERTELPPGATEVVRERFRRRSIFRQVCPHAVAGKRVRIARLASDGRLDDAVRVARSICRDVPAEPRNQIDLADLLDRAGKPEEAAAIYGAIAAETETVSSTLRAEALLSLADQAARAGNLEQASQILARAAALPVDEAHVRNIEAQRFIASAKSPGATELRAFFWAARDREDRLARLDAAIAREPENGLAHYLRGRHSSDSDPPAAVAGRLGRALDLGLPHPLIQRECARLLAEASFRANDLAGVERAASILMEPEQSQVVQLYGADWLERIHFRRHGALP
jgi:hypothetical protein